MNEAPFLFLQLIPFLLVWMTLGFTAHFLAKEKGRNVVLWTVLGSIPVVGVFCISFFIGAANLRLEKKIDQLLQAKPH